MPFKDGGCCAPDSPSRAPLEVRRTLLYADPCLIYYGGAQHVNKRDGTTVEVCSCSAGCWIYLSIVAVGVILIVPVVTESHPMKLLKLWSTRKSNTISKLRAAR